MKLRWRAIVRLEIPGVSETITVKLIFPVPSLHRAPLLGTEPGDSTLFRRNCKHSLQRSPLSFRLLFRARFKILFTRKD